MPHRLEHHAKRMPRRMTSLTVILTSCVMLQLLSLMVPAQESEDTDWSVKFFVSARSDFDRWTRAPGPARQQWMREHYDRMLTYSPYFDSRLQWYPQAWLYKDSYAIHTDSSIAKEHPDWVLHDEDGNQLYIPYDCSRGRCPQYAGDIGNPEFRLRWIADLRRKLEKGYLGVYVDDVNLDWRVSDGFGDYVKPIDPRTGKTMSLADWRRYFAEFMELIRQEFPDIEIVHNAIWYATPVDDPFIIRQVQAADYIGIERGATDDGIVAGRGKYGFQTFLAFIDRVHRLGGSILLDDDDSDTSVERDFELAAYFLVTTGNDLIGADGDRRRMRPGDFWQGYELNLGPPVSEHFRTRERLIARDFECGRVLLNEPGRPSTVVRVEPGFVTMDGEQARLERLSGASALILIRDDCDVPEKDKRNN
jgi:hypothetical protein